ncbi:MAG: hypothetical protein QF444_02445 [Phycisphaerales bacterium]|jgi:hypothetical protein|nr:hypothetical protein [Phycisphaerales bacterium]
MWRLLLITFFLLVSCKTQKVEYRTRPAWHYAMGTEMPNEEVGEDGTIIRYTTVGGSQSSAVANYLDGIELRSENEITGEVTLRAILPEHVLEQTLVCLRDRDWNLLYEQVLSTATRENYEAKEYGREEFIAFFEKNRKELGKTVQRLLRGKSFGDVVHKNIGNFVVVSFAPGSVGNFKFHTVKLCREGEFLKLAIIE